MMMKCLEKRNSEEWTQAITYLPKEDKTEKENNF